jgi:hypothetical protein
MESYALVLRLQPRLATFTPTRLAARASAGKVCIISNQSAGRSVVVFSRGLCGGSTPVIAGGTGVGTGAALTRDSESLCVHVGNPGQIPGLRIEDDGRPTPVGSSGGVRLGSQNLAVRQTASPDHEIREL